MAALATAGLTVSCGAGSMATTGPEGGTSEPPEAPQDNWQLGGDDHDGFPDDLDCDDENPFVYPGVHIACSDACGAGVKRCGEDGEYEPCTCSPLCEAVGGGHCYYVDAAAGDDSAAGSFSTPWRTLANVVSYYDPEDEAPATWVGVAPGDVIYLMTGVHDWTYSYWSDGEFSPLFLRGAHGTSSAPITFRAYPGPRPRFLLAGSADGLQVRQSSHIILDGFEIDSAYGNGVFIEESERVEVRNCLIHDTDGWGGGNRGTGVYLAYTEDADVHHNRLYDNYERATPEDPTHKQNIIIFAGGGAIRVSYNFIYQTNPGAPYSSMGMLYKHSATVVGSSFEVFGNVIAGCRADAIGSGTFNTHVHHNLVIDSGRAFSATDFGGPTTNADLLVEYNTLVTGGAVAYAPSQRDAPIGDFRFRRNIVVSSIGDAVEIGRYLDDDLYDATVDHLAFADNCYFKDGGGALSWGLFAANGGAYGAKGQTYAFEGWQAEGFDAGSMVADPGLDPSYAPTLSGCQGMGWLAP